jgi:hypothetical protein
MNNMTPMMNVTAIRSIIANPEIMSVHPSIFSVLSPTACKSRIRQSFCLGKPSQTFRTVEASDNSFVCLLSFALYKYYEKKPLAPMAIIA